MYKFNVMLQGTCPMLFNGWTQQATAALGSTGKRGGTKTADDLLVDAFDKAYRDPQTGAYYVSSHMLRPSFAEGAGLLDLKVKRRGLKFYMDRAVIPDHAYFYTGEEDVNNVTNVPYAIGNKEPVLEIPYYDSRPIATKSGAALNIRPAFGIHNYIDNNGVVVPDKPWQANTTVYVGMDNLDMDDIVEAIHGAGLLAGLGSFLKRYGKFIVVQVGKKEPVDIKATRDT